MTPRPWPELLADLEPHRQLYLVTAEPTTLDDLAEAGDQAAAALVDRGYAGHPVAGPTWVEATLRSPRAVGPRDWLAGAGANEQLDAARDHLAATDWEYLGTDTWRHQVDPATVPTEALTWRPDELWTLTPGGLRRPGAHRSQGTGGSTT